MNEPIIVVGLGQLGCVFAEAFLRSGHPVLPVRRQDPLNGALQAARTLSDGRGTKPLLVIATGEDDLPPVLSDIPTDMKDRVVLLQNELRPSTWAEGGITGPTVCVVWFEKKPGKLLSEVRPSVAFGPEAEKLSCVLQGVGVQVDLLGASDSPNERAHQLILKNLYILGLNLAGLDAPSSSASEVLKGHTELLRAVTDEVITLEQKLLETPGIQPRGEETCVRLEPARLERELDQAILADPDHGASGRSAKRRLKRTLALSRQLGLQLKVLEALASRHL